MRGGWTVISLIRNTPSFLRAVHTAREIRKRGAFVWRVDIDGYCHLLHLLNHLRTFWATTDLYQRTQGKVLTMPNYRSHEVVSLSDKHGKLYTETSCSVRCRWALKRGKGRKLVDWLEVPFWPVYGRIFRPWKRRNEKGEEHTNHVWAAFERMGLPPEPSKRERRNGRKEVIIFGIVYDKKKSLQPRREEHPDLFSETANVLRILAFSCWYVKKALRLLELVIYFLETSNIFTWKCDNYWVAERSP